MLIAEALRLLRTRQGLTQTAASKLDGAPDFSTLSHWENRRKLPSLRLLIGYLRALELDFSDLQDALDQVQELPPTSCRVGLARLEQRVVMLERRLGMDRKAQDGKAAEVRCRGGR